MTGTDPREGERYAVLLPGQARHNIRENLPLEVALAAMETIEGAIAVNPYRVGKPLDEPLDGYFSARRGTYRIDEAKPRWRFTRSATAAALTAPDPDDSHRT